MVTEQLLTFTKEENLSLLSRYKHLRDHKRVTPDLSLDEHDANKSLWGDNGSGVTFLF